MFRGSLNYELTAAERQLLFQALNAFTDKVEDVYAETDPAAQQWAVAKTEELRNRFKDN